MKNIFLYYFLAIVLLLAFPKSSKADFVVNQSIISNEMTQEEIIHIFFFYKKYDARQGSKLVVILPPANSYLFKQLATKELNTSASQYLTSVKAKIAEGSASPIFVETEAEVLIKVSNTPYSIGYFYDSLKLNDGYGVKTVIIK